MLACVYVCFCVVCFACVCMCAYVCSMLYVLFACACVRACIAFLFNSLLQFSFEDHTLYHAECHTSTVYITSRQDAIVSYCKNQTTYRGNFLNLIWLFYSEALLRDTLTRLANAIVNLLTFNFLVVVFFRLLHLYWCPFVFLLKGEIHVSDIRTGKCIARISQAQALTAAAQSALNPLDEITALSFNEEKNEVYSGNSEGVIHIWSAWWAIYIFVWLSQLSRKRFV